MDEIFWYSIPYFLFLFIYHSSLIVEKWHISCEKYLAKIACFKGFENKILAAKNLFLEGNIFNGVELVSEALLLLAPRTD